MSPIMMPALSLLSKAAVLVLLVLTAKSLQRRYFHKLSKYPGPWLASITHLWVIYNFSTGEHHLVDRRLHEKYGPVVRVAPDRLLFSDFAAYQAIYGTHKYMEKGQYHRTTGEFEPERANLLQTRTDEQHREKKRKVVSPALTSSRVAEYESIVTKATTTLVQILDRQSTLNSMINMALISHRFVGDVTYEIAFGIPMHFQHGDRDDLLELKNQVVRFSFMIPLVPWFGNIWSSGIVSRWVRKRTYDHCGNPTNYNSFIHPSMKAVADTVEKGHGPEACALNNYQKVPLEDSRRMSQQEIWRECFQIGIAGMGSTASAITTTLYNLALHPDWQARVFDELKTQAACYSPLPESGNMMPYAAINELPALQAVMKESLRLAPPVSMGTPRYIAAGAETAIPGLSSPLPVGTMVGSNIYVVSHSKEVYGEDADEWKPERWIRKDNKIDTELPWVIFGRGSRSCVGKEIVWMTVKKAVVAVLGKWELSTYEGSLKGRNNGDMQYDQMMLNLKPRVDPVVFKGDSKVEQEKSWVEDPKGRRMSIGS